MPHCTIAHVNETHANTLADNTSPTVATSTFSGANVAITNPPVAEKLHKYSAKNHEFGNASAAHSAFLTVHPRSPPTPNAACAVGGPSNASATALYVNDITIAANGGTYRCVPDNASKISSSS